MYWNFSYLQYKTTQNNTLNVKLSNSQLSKVKLGIKNGAEVTSLNVVGDSSYENNFLHKFLLTNTQDPKLCKAFANGSSANIKLIKLNYIK